MGPPVTPEDFKHDSDTLRYDYWMVVSTALEYARAEEKGYTLQVQNALVESFAIRTRSLVEFFFFKYDARRNADDIRAAHFVPGWSMPKPPYIDEWLENINKTVAHVTAKRRALNQPDTGKELTWNMLEIIENLSDVVRYFLSQCRRELLSDSAYQSMTALANQYGSHNGPQGPANSSNRAAQGVTGQDGPLKYMTDIRTYSPGPTFGDNQGG